MKLLLTKMSALAAIATLAVGGSVAAQPPVHELQPASKSRIFEETGYTYQQCIRDLLPACAAAHVPLSPGFTQCIADGQAYCETLPGAP